MLLEALGGFVESLVVFGAFVIYPINQRYFDEEYQNVHDELYYHDKLEVAKRLRIEDIFQMKQLLLATVSANAESHGHDRLFSLNDHAVIKRTI